MGAGDSGSVCGGMGRYSVRSLASLLVTAALLAAASAEVTITDNGYSGVLVGISKDVPEDDGPQLIEAIKVGAAGASMNDKQTDV